MNDSRDETIDALRLSEQQRLAILNKMKRRVQAYNRHDCRTSDRKPFYIDGVVVEMHHPGGSRVRYRVQTVNLSAQGVGFLHGSFCYTGTPAYLTLESRGQTRIKLQGKVVRCQLVEGHVHEIGVMFNNPIDMGDFLDDCTGEAGGEIANPKLPRLRGRVLYIEDSLDNRELMGFMTDQMGLELSAVETVEQAGEILGKQTFDLVVADLWLADYPGEQVVNAVREAGHAGPILGATAQDDVSPEELIGTVGCTAVLMMPFTGETLAASFEQFLLHDRLTDANAQPLLSDQWSNVTMRPVIMDFLGRLEHSVVEFESLLQQDAQELLRRQVYELKSAAGGFGYARISQAAQQVMSMIDQQAESAELRKQMNALIDLCTAACLGNRKSTS